MSSAAAGPVPIDVSCDPALVDLAAEVRQLTEGTVRARFDEPTLEVATSRLASAADALEASLRDGSARLTRGRGAGMSFHANPVLGPANPFAPPLPIEVVDGAIVGHVRLHRAYEGPPGQVHGGVLSLLLDQTLGLANVVAGVPGMTRSLHVRFHRPTPLYTDLVVHSVHARVEDRDVIAEGSIRVGDTTTVTAEGRFRQLSPERGRVYFERHLDAEGTRSA